MKVSKAALGVGRPGRRPHRNGLTAWEHWTRVHSGGRGKLVDCLSSKKRREYEKLKDTIF